MTIALAFETDDGSRAIQTHIEIHTEDGVRTSDADFQSYYDLERTMAQLRTGGYRNIALQFPDSLLSDAPRVQLELQLRLGQEHMDRIFVLGDTSYGSCCVDEVAAQHLKADCIVHYGRTCLSATSKIPVIYVFGNAPIELAPCVETLTTHIEALAPEQRIVLLYEPCYHHMSKKIHKALKSRFNDRRVLYGSMRTLFDPSNPEHQTFVAVASNTGLNSKSFNENTFIIGGQEIQLNDEDPRELTPEAYSIVYIGSESPHLTSILMRFSTFASISYNPQTQNSRLEGANVNRTLMRRFYLVQKAKEAQIFGILMGTLGVSKYLDVVHSLQRLIKQSGRKSYLFVVGKVNIPKLANYAEIDAFVLVACQQNTLMDSKEYFKPIITPYELHLALSENEEWTGQYKTDFREVLPLLDSTTQELFQEQLGLTKDEDTDKPFFSLVTGTYTTAGRASTTRGMYAISNDEVSSTALQLRNQNEELIEYRSEAAEYLATREYRGLEPRIGETEAHAAIMGTTGIAKGYDHEK